MSKYARKLLWSILGLIAAIAGVIANWFWPLYLWLGDTALYRFVWLGIFFIFIDIIFEVVSRMFKDLTLMVESVAFSKNIRKLSDSFCLVSKVVLPNNLKADYVIAGSSGIWLVDIKDEQGTITFNGEDLIQGRVVLKGLITKSLEKSYGLANLLKNKFQRDFVVTPIIAFSSPKADLKSVSKIVKGVHISAGQDTVALVENTDIQLVDKNTAEEICKLLKP